MHCLAQDASDAVAAAASSPGVYWIEPKTAISVRNWSGKSIIGTGSSQTFTSASAPNPSKVFSTISLQNSVIGVADSGISINNCYFCSLNISKCSSATGSTSARNIKKYPQLCVFCATLRCNPLLMYWFMDSASCAKCGRCGSAAAGTLPAQACGNDYDEDGHGSHVAGVPVATSLLHLSTRCSRQAFTFSSQELSRAPQTWP
jgi:subtilisin family serine protease